MGKAVKKTKKKDREETVVKPGKAGGKVEGALKKSKKDKKDKKDKRADKENKKAAKLASLAESSDAPQAVVEAAADAKQSKKLKQKKHKSNAQNTCEHGAKGGDKSGTVLEQQVNASTKDELAAQVADKPKKKKKKRKEEAQKQKKRKALDLEAQAGLELMELDGCDELSEEEEDDEEDQTAAPVVQMENNGAVTLDHGNVAEDQEYSGAHGTAKGSFRRVKDEEWVGKRGSMDNTYEGTFGAAGWGHKAQQILGAVRGKDFRHEKTKKKRGSYFGGKIDSGARHSFKYDSD